MGVINKNVKPHKYITTIKILNLTKEFLNAYRVYSKKIQNYYTNKLTRHSQNDVN